MDMQLMGVLAAAGESGGSGESGWSVTSLLAGGAQTLQTWGALILFILGCAAIIAGVYKLVTGLVSHGQKQTSWVVVILLILVGGILTVGSALNAWQFVAGTVAGTGFETLNDLGTGNTGAGEVSIGNAPEGMVLFGETEAVIELAA